MLNFNRGSYCIRNLNRDERQRTIDVKTTSDALVFRNEMPEIPYHTITDIEVIGSYEYLEKSTSILSIILSMLTAFVVTTLYFVFIDYFRVAPEMRKTFYFIFTEILLFSPLLAILIYILATLILKTKRHKKSYEVEVEVGADRYLFLFTQTDLNKVVTRISAVNTPKKKKK